MGLVQKYGETARRQLNSVSLIGTLVSNQSERA